MGAREYRDASLDRLLNLLRACYSRFLAWSARVIAQRNKFLPMGLLNILGLNSTLSIKFTIIYLTKVTKMTKPHIACEVTEITPAMIDAGVDLFWVSFPEAALASQASVSEMVSAIVHQVFSRQNQ